MLLFKKIYKDAILNGTKTTTVRSWKRNICKTGSSEMTNLGIRLFIESVDHITVNDITDDMARADGFDSSEALITRLHETYKNLPDVLTLVKFHVDQTPSQTFTDSP